MITNIVIKICWIDIALILDASVEKAGDKKMVAREDDPVTSPTSLVLKPLNFKRMAAHPINENTFAQ